MYTIILMDAHAIKNCKSAMIVPTTNQDTFESVGVRYTLNDWDYNVTVDQVR